ncbi:hypothetical protein [Anoxybacillus sp. J5B_2022]|uniref:hypothetical protein n=1 Tax=Anoxybacillus sp. J5B_2022 TaxID=3003246 RepID=UPI002286416B|nr:hypothetical protein [Anoxybacillus sp. J5B_2022]MCZ0757117.1 hypothetical protein [Anoxybacillus sp. J5B_2022]
MSVIKTKVTVERIVVVHGENRATLRVCKDVYLNDYLLYESNSKGQKVPIGLSGKKVKKLQEWNDVKIENKRLFSFLLKAYMHEKEVFVHLEKREKCLYVVGVEFC